MKDQETSYGYSILFNCFTDCIIMLERIKEEKPRYEMLTARINEVITKMANAQELAEAAYIVVENEQKFHHTDLPAEITDG